MGAFSSKVHRPLKFLLETQIKPGSSSTAVCLATAAWFPFTQVRIWHRSEPTQWLPCPHGTHWSCSWLRSQSLPSLELSRAFVYALALLCIGSFQEKKVPQGFPILPVLQIWILLSRMQFIRQIKVTVFMNSDSQALKSLFPWHHLWWRGERNMAEKERECERNRGSQ